jgi:hypothetical protein
MGDLFSGLSGGSGSDSSSSGSGFGNFLTGMGTGFVNQRLGPNNPYTGVSPMSSLYTQLVQNNGAMGNANAAQNDPTMLSSPLMQPGQVPAPSVSQFGSPVSSTPNAQWGTEEWGTPQG